MQARGTLVRLELKGPDDADTKAEELAEALVRQAARCSISSCMQGKAVRAAFLVRCQLPAAVLACPCPFQVAGLGRAALWWSSDPQTLPRMAWLSAVLPPLLLAPPLTRPCFVSPVWQRGEPAQGRGHVAVHHRCLLVMETTGVCWRWRPS